MPRLPSASPPAEGTEHTLLLGRTYALKSSGAEGATIDSATRERPFPARQLDELLSRLGKEAVHTTAFFLSTLRTVADETTATEFESQVRKGR